ncbi:MAG: response regulator, partial [Nitrospirae bacterium]|nr:response regulator [Nitrospirota bacterium]
VKALDKAQKVMPDIILLDVLMPEMDGFETCQRLKTIPVTADIPIIFISSLTDISEKVKAFKSGGVDYISKPFLREEILARVETHLKLHNLQKYFEERVKEEVEKNRLKDQLINKQSRHIAMGELLVNIAHHWRQPINSIGVIV